MVIFQRPNKPLFVAIPFIIAAHFLQGNWHNAAWLIGNTALTIWAVMEIVDGDSWFRRILGIVVMAGVISSAVMFFAA